MLLSRACHNSPLQPNRSCISSSCPGTLFVITGDPILPPIFSSLLPYLFLASTGIIQEILLIPKAQDFQNHPSEVAFFLLVDTNSLPFRSIPPLYRVPPTKGLGEFLPYFPSSNFGTLALKPVVLCFSFPKHGAITAFSLSHRNVRRSYSLEVINSRSHAGLPFPSLSQRQNRAQIGRILK